MNALMIVGLAIVIAIPLAFLIDVVRTWQRTEKMFAPLREIVPNIVPADGFKLHEVSAVVRKPRKSNVTSLRDPPRAA